MEDETAATVIAAADSASEQAQAPGEVRLSTGVVVRVRAMSRDVYEDILARFHEPPVPVEDVGKGRLEENPSNKAYIDALRAYNAQVNRAVKLAVYVLAVDVISTPDPEMGPDGTAWLEKRQRAGLSSGDTPLARKLDWLRFYAARADEDSGAILRMAGRMLGVLEADVQGAMKSV